jgi:hypothetical protein
MTLAEHPPNWASLRRRLCVSLNRPVEVVGRRDGQHAPSPSSFAPRTRRSPASRPGLRPELELGQIDLVRGEHDLLAVIPCERIDVDGRAAGRKAQRGAVLQLIARNHRTAGEQITDPVCRRGGRRDRRSCPEHLGNHVRQRPYRAGLSRAHCFRPAPAPRIAKPDSEQSPPRPVNSRSEASKIRVSAIANAPGSLTW